MRRPIVSEPPPPLPRPTPQQAQRAAELALERIGIEVRRRRAEVEQIEGVEKRAKHLAMTAETSAWALKETVPHAWYLPDRVKRAFLAYGATPKVKKRQVALLDLLASFGTAAA